MTITEGEGRKAGSRKAALLAFLVCVLLGPPLGSLPVSLTFALLDPAHTANNLLEEGQLLLTVSLFAYIVGGIPAIMGGTGAAVLIRRHGTLSYRAAALLGLGSGALFGLILSLGSTPRSGDETSSMVSTVVFLAIFSLISALVCRWLLPRFRIIP